MSVRLAELTTLRVGGPAERLVEARTTDELVDAVREVDDADEPLLVLGGGSNLVVADAGFAVIGERLQRLGAVDEFLVFGADTPGAFRLHPFRQMAHQIVAILDQTAGRLRNGHALPCRALRPCCDCVN